MNKKIAIIVSSVLVFAILVIAVIISFPNYLFKDDTPSSTTSGTQSNPDEYTVGGVGEGVQAVLPGFDDFNKTDSNESESNSDKIPTLSLKTIAQAKNAAIEAENGAFSDEAKITLKKLGWLDKEYYSSRNYTKEFAKNFVAYKFTATQDGNAVLPIAYVRMAITAPTSYDINNVEVYYLLSDGGVEKLNFSVDKISGTVYVEANVTGTYILIEKKPVKDEENSSSKEDVSSNEDASSSEGSSSSEDTSSEDNTSSDSNNSESDDSSKDTMDGWTPWY